MTSRAVHNPISDRTIRERTFEVVGNREDKKDIHGIITLTVQQLMDDKTTGQIVLNFNGGHVASITVKETKRS